MNRFNKMYRELMEQITKPMPTNPLGSKKNYYDQVEDLIKSDEDKIKKKKVGVAQQKAMIARDSERVSKRKELLRREKEAQVK